jgi:hypothetical protein
MDAMAVAGKRIVCMSRLTGLCFFFTACPLSSIEHVSYSSLDSDLGADGYLDTASDQIAGETPTWGADRGSSTFLQVFQTPTAITHEPEYIGAVNQ